MIKEYSHTIKSLLNDKIISKGANISDITSFEMKGQVHFYWGRTLLLVTDVMYANNITKLIEKRPTKHTEALIKTKAKVKKKLYKIHPEESKTFRQRVYERDGYKCLKCGCDEINWLTLDHIVPRAKGGKNSVANLQTLCANCNMEKGDKHSTDYRKTIL